MEGAALGGAQYQSLSAPPTPAAQAKTETSQMVEVCMQLLDQRDAETAIRIGDVFALLVYFHAQHKAWPAAHGLVESMRARAIPLDPFIDAPLIETIYTNVGEAPPSAQAAQAPAPAEGDIEEELTVST